MRKHTRKMLVSVISWSLTSAAIAGATPAAADEPHGWGPALPTGEINVDTWGRIVAPTFGTSESASAYAGAEFFAGPNKFSGNYFAGVLPNGKFVKPAGKSIQVGMNPLGAALTPDGRFLITTNDDEREGGYVSYAPGGAKNTGGYSLSVVDTSTMTVVSTITAKQTFFVGLQVTGPKNGPYTVWASGGPQNDVKVITLDTNGNQTGSTKSIPIRPALPADQGYVSNYSPAASMNTTGANGAATGNLPPAPSGFNRTAGAQITFPAGMAVSPDGKWLYVACNGDNSVAVIDTSQQTVVAQQPVGFFPYTVAVSASGKQIAVSNWGVSAYLFKGATYDNTGKLSALGAANANNPPDGFYVPVTDAAKTSTVTLLNVAVGGGAPALTQAAVVKEGRKLDDLNDVGDTHPSASVIVTARNGRQVLYVAKTNVDKLSVIDLASKRKIGQFDLSLKAAGWGEREDEGDDVTEGGIYPNAIVASPDNSRLYVAEAGLNSVAVLDVHDPDSPRLVGRLPTGWYPTALAISADGGTLYVANAKGIGEDVNPAIATGGGSAPPSGVISDPSVDSNYIFGTVQKIDLWSAKIDNRSVLANAYAVRDDSSLDKSVVPVGGRPSKKIKHVIFILHENKTFDSMLGNQPGHFGAFASLTYNTTTGTPYTTPQFTGVALNTQALATKFATAANYYSESEESDAGHQFAASGTASDYTEKTLLVKSGRGLLVNKNFEPEDYPAHGYIFNNAARHGVSFKDYGAMIRIEGTDTGTSTPTTLNDSTGNAGFPQLNPPNVVVPINNLGDTSSPTNGLGQSYFVKLPILAVLGENNPSGEPRLDQMYPGYNFNISDQRRAEQFIEDFDRMVAAGTLPQFLYIYQPNDHTGSVQALNAGSVTSGNTPLAEVADGDVGLGMVVKHIMDSPIYYDKGMDTGSAIFITYDDAQATTDHIHPHRTPLIVVSPFAKPGHVAKRHYSTASVVKTEELLLGLPPNNLGDLLATDLRDMFQSTYNGIKSSDFVPTLASNYVPSAEAEKIWQLAERLDTSAPDRDSRRLGALTRLTIEADELREAFDEHRVSASEHEDLQAQLYAAALNLVGKGGEARND